MHTPSLRADSIIGRVGPGGPGGYPPGLPQTRTCSHSSMRFFSQQIRYPRRVPVAIRPSFVDMRESLDVFSMFPSVKSAGRRFAVGWGTGARTVGSGGGSTPFDVGLSPAPMATFPAAPPKIPYGGFSPVRLKVPGTTQFSESLPLSIDGLSLIRTCTTSPNSWLSSSGSP